ncbi:N8gamma [macacine gammaherpesvirus 12]|uniref:N8gamma n=1 Tax=macacine gammaherpesvirus 12 TaxID=2560571 RepID=A0A0B5CYV2_9GAMA|nr:N8gamma [Macaca nemestrina rhadinovirus 2]AJE29695.1 N8gamma [Macaca nemestrina rhadinovirus 2]
MPRVKTQPTRPQGSEFMFPDLHGETHAGMESQNICPDGQDLLGSYTYMDPSGQSSQTTHNGQGNDGTVGIPGGYITGDRLLGISSLGMYQEGTGEGAYLKKTTACRKRSAALIRIEPGTSITEPAPSHDGGASAKLLKVRVMASGKLLNTPRLSWCVFTFSV